MCIGSNYGIKINKPTKFNNIYEYFFGEDQSRYILEVEEKNFKKVEKILKNNSVFFENIGIAQKDYIEIPKELKIATKDLYKINNQWYKNY